MKYIVSSIFLCCCVILTHAQLKSGVKKGDLQIGEQTELIYEIKTYSKPIDIQFIPFKKTIPALRFTEESTYENPDSIEIEVITDFKEKYAEKKGENTWIGSYTITVWDTGYFVIPPFEAKSADSLVQFSPILIHVTAPKEIQGKELYDIKEEFFEIPFDWGDWFQQYKYWIFACIVLIGLVLVFFYLKRKKLSQVEDTRTLEEKTLLAIDSLYDSGLWKNGENKAYYSELSFILRSYLGARFELNLLERTSMETIGLLKQKGLKIEVLNSIRLVLDQADLVKFAKFTSTDLDIEHRTKETKNIVIETTKMQLQNVQ